MGSRPLTVAIVGATGAVASTVKPRAADRDEVKPAASRAWAVKLCAPSVRLPAV